MLVSSSAGSGVLYSDVVLMAEFNAGSSSAGSGVLYSDVVLMAEFNDWFLLLLVQECNTVM